MQLISAFSLTNKGGYVAHPHIEWYDAAAQKWKKTDVIGGDLDVDGDRHIKISDVKDVAGGEMVRLRVDAVWGSHAESKEMYYYDQSSLTVIYYICDGTSLDVKVKLR
jgi:hypothetical protein